MNHHGKNVKKLHRGVVTAVVAIALLIAAIVLLGELNGSSAETNAYIAENGDLVIPKSEISDTVKFYPYFTDKIKMEIMAVKSTDGSVKTALNTCQICYDSGRGYYKQQGDSVICQNCGNQFKIDEIEKVKGGCNPVPVLEESKSDDGSHITISKAFLEESKFLFIRWKK